MGTNCDALVWQVRLARNPDFSKKLVPLSLSHYRPVRSVKEGGCNDYSCNLIFCWHTSLFQSTDGMPMIFRDQDFSCDAPLPSVGAYRGASSVGGFALRHVPWVVSTVECPSRARKTTG